MTTRTVHARMHERVQTRDTLLSPVTAAELAAASAAGFNAEACGRIWTGILETVQALPAKARDEILSRMDAYVKAQGGVPGPDGLTTAPTTDGARVAGATRDTIRGLNDANKKYWADVEASRPRG